MVEIVHSTLEKEVAGVQTEHIDLTKEILRSGQSISDLLQNQSTAVLRGYGPGSSFGLSVRGAGTGQSQVLIDGIPFENPSLGSADLSLLPVAVFNELTLYRGGASAYLGNGAIGGSLMLGTADTAKESGISQLLETGSFGKRNAVTAVNLQVGKLHSRTVFYYQEAQNDFLRADPLDRDEEEPQPNAFFKGRGLVEKLDYALNKRSQIGLFLWANETFRQIPPNISKPDAQTFQEDENYRVQGNFSTEKFGLKLALAASVDGAKLDYFDAGITSHTSYETYHAQAKIAKNTQRWDAYLMAVFHEAKAETNNYSGMQIRKTPSLVGGWVSNFFGDKTRGSITIRQAFLNGEALPVVPVFGLEQQIIEGFHLKASAGKSYRVPGLNDLYWNPGGNPNLKAESGWFQELGFAYSNQQNKRKLDLELTGFHREISNWIQWAPGPAYWSAENLKAVQSYGGEFSANLTQQVSQWKLSHHFSSAFVKSVNQGADNGSDDSDGKQLIYTPELTLAASETLELKGFSLRLLGYYESLRYTTSDNSKSLDAYFLLDAELGKRLEWSRLQCDVFGAIRNVFDQAYQLKASHSMPGVNFEIGIKINYHIKTKTRNEN